MHLLLEVAIMLGPSSREAEAPLQERGAVESALASAGFAALFTCCASVLFVRLLLVPRSHAPRQSIPLSRNLTLV